MADQRWKTFAGFERKVEDATVMRGEEGVVGDVLPGEIFSNIEIRYLELLTLSASFIYKILISEQILPIYDESGFCLQ